jgi:hypothetical protein
MALIAHQVFNGLSIPDCYIQVDVLSVTSQEINYLLHRSVNANSPTLYTTMHIAPHNLNDGNAIKQAYEHAKSLPEMSNAIDCFAP